ncbi:nucleotidyltransferase family protein [Paenibacillus mucilaginosus]|uniref:nucleotidyltransferase family protein n=1 Tax=Paenibacillus mucilaginosus TaxID=61624 RepID=UPI0009D99B5F|nr:nucleotidyltransferase family protein [Paenibacillus mucilaginosus]MCG7214462.1 nucleotidyltransferase family protein [Paenibacillus mucilaginosus]WDM30744.1 NTP transferase domain-containing protein [Paenibacillus mucilaginosus]
MGGSKLSIPLGGTGKLGGCALEEALRSRLDRICVVTRTGSGADWLPADYYAAERQGRAVRVPCADAGMGMSHSLRAGLMAACADSVPDAVVVLLADQPLVTAAMIDRLLASFREQPKLDYCAAGHEGMPKPPVLLSRTMFASVEKLAGDQGARVLLSEPHVFGMIQDEPEEHRFYDADTPEDLERIRFFYS